MPVDLRSDTVTRPTTAMRQAMMERASRAPLKGRVQFLPLIPVSEVPRYINLATVGVYLGLDVPKQVRALPTKLFEYMGCGIPVLASDLPYSREFVAKHNAGMLAKPGNAGDFAKKVCLFLDDRELGRQLGENGRKVVFSSLNWEKEMDRLVEYYQGILKGRQPG